ncbi:transposase family protein [Streptomyces sp. SID8352]|uniref:transposase family protein n=1 Tax=Streptomyces sp. SID8352 TaxID=2690338 RepID=UPI0031F68AE1
MPDPQSRRGIRHPWTALLTAAAAAVLAGAASVTAIGEWVADAPQRVLAVLGFRPDPLTGLIRPPHATTIRLVLAAVDGDALDRATGGFPPGTPDSGTWTSSHRRRRQDTPRPAPALPGG